MSTARSRTARRGRASSWFTDRPVAVKLAAVVGTMASVAGLIAVLALNGVDELHDGEQRLYSEVVEPMDTLGAIQRSFQGDRARVIQYAIADVATRQELRTELTERRGDIQDQLVPVRP